MHKLFVDDFARSIAAKVSRRETLRVLAVSGLAAIGIAGAADHDVQATTKAQRRRKRQKAYRKRRHARIRAYIAETIDRCLDHVPEDAACYEEWCNCCYFFDNMNTQQGIDNYCACLGRTGCVQCPPGAIA